MPHPPPEPGNQRENPPCASELRTSWPQRPRHHQRARLFQPGRGRRELAPTPSPRSSIHRGAVGHAPDRRIVASGLGRRPAARWQPVHCASQGEASPARRSGSHRSTIAASQCAREPSQYKLAQHLAPHARRIGWTTDPRPHGRTPPEGESARIGRGTLLPVGRSGCGPH